MRRLLAGITVVVMAALLPGQAMELKTCDTQTSPKTGQIILSGDVESGDLAKFQKALAEHPDINTVVLRNSRGGDATSGYALGEFFRSEGISTYVSGYCLSSCSRIFLGGKERFFTDAFRLGTSAVGFHSNYDKSGAIVRGAQEKLTRFIAAHADGKADAALVERWVNIKDRRGFAYFFHPTRLKRADGVSMLMCKGDEGNERWKLCEKIVGHDALSMGIITSLEVKRSCDLDAQSASSADTLPASDDARQ